jgi:hypothetical protein
MGAGPPPVPQRGLPAIAMARTVTRDPDPGAVGPALERIDALLDAAEHVIRSDDETSPLVTGLLAAANTIAVTEPLEEAQ